MRSGSLRSGSSWRSNRPVETDRERKAEEVGQVPLSWLFHCRGIARATADRAAARTAIQHRVAADRQGERVGRFARSPVRR